MSAEGGKASSKKSPMLVVCMILVIGLQVVGLLFVSGLIKTNKNADHCVYTETPVTDKVKSDGEEGQDNNEIKITKSLYATTDDDQQIDKYLLQNANGLKAEVITLGGIITSLKVPCRHGHFRDIIAGYEHSDDYIKEKSHVNFGAIIGRVANRIANGNFSIDGQSFHVATNGGDHFLHGGNYGFDKKIWKASVSGDTLTLFYKSKCCEEGFRGLLHVYVTYRLNDDNEFEINMKAKLHNKKATVINLSMHPYFNLNGAAYNKTIHDHEVTIHADSYVEVDEELIPTGNMPNVNATLFDLRTPVILGDRLSQIQGGPHSGYDQCFAIRGPTGLRYAAKVRHPKSGRVMEIFTNQPGLQFYTGNSLEAAGGKGGQTYRSYSAFTMEPENYPDAINHCNFPDSILRPGATYHNQMIFKFSTDIHDQHNMQP